MGTVSLSGPSWSSVSDMLAYGGDDWFLVEIKEWVLYAPASRLPKKEREAGCSKIYS